MADLMDAVLQNNRHVADNIDAWGALYDNAKVADAMVKANPDLVQRMGFQDPKQFHTLSAQDKIAATTGYIKQQGVQEHIAQLQAYQDASAQRQQQVQDDQSVGSFLQNYGSAPETVKDANGVDQPLTPTQKLQWALTNTPGMSGRNVPRAIQALGEWQRATTADKPEADVTPRETTVAGKKVIFNPRTGNFQTVQDDTEVQPQPVLGENDELMGHMIKGKFYPVPKASTPRPTIPAGAKPKTINGVDYFEDDAGNLYKAPTKAAGSKTSQLLDTLKGGAPASTAAPTAEPLPLNGGKIDAGKLEAGKVYQTARGPATWDGKQFNQ